MRVLDFLKQHTDYAEYLGDDMYRFMFHGKMHRQEFLTDADVNRYLNKNVGPAEPWDGPDEEHYNE